MTDGTMFRLQPEHLGRHHVSDAIFLHARVSTALDRICQDVPGCIVDVLDRDGDRIPVPSPASSFVQPIEMLYPPTSAPDRVVVYGPEAAARDVATFLGMPGRPYVAPDGIAFELGREHLCRDQFNLIHLDDNVRRAIKSALDAAPNSRFRILDGEGYRIRSAQQLSLAAAPYGEDQDLSMFTSGFEPQHVVFYDRRAAATFAQVFPAMCKEELASLERRWRRARIE
jgi:hypothetical protein